MFKHIKNSMKTTKQMKVHITIDLYRENKINVINLFLSAIKDSCTDRYAYVNKKKIE
jgi:hypothetical protein